MIFHSYLISNRQFQDVVKNFSDLLYFENEASYEKVLFYFRIIFPRRIILSAQLCTTSYGYTTNKTNANYRAKYEKHPFCSFVQFLTHENTERTQESRRNHVSSVFNSFALTMRFCFSTWHFFSPYAIITCKNRLFWKQLWKLLRFVWFIKKFSSQLFIGERFEIRW